MNEVPGRNLEILARTREQGELPGSVILGFLTLIPPFKRKWWHPLHPFYNLSVIIRMLAHSIRRDLGGEAGGGERRRSGDA